MMNLNVLYDWHRPVTPRSLSLWSLSTAAPVPLRAARLIARAAIFGVEAAAVRVALGRLVRERMVCQVSRGTYGLGPAAAAIHAKARGWARAERGVRPWRGDWIVVLVDHLGRTDRARLQAREQALRLTGFVVSRPGAWVRPDNLALDPDQLTADLRGLGLDSDAVMLSGCSVGAADDAAFRGLWPQGPIEDGYRRWIAEIAASAARVPGLGLTDAARETFLLGQSVIRAINSDPLLPDELVDVPLRMRLARAMIDYDAMARQLWVACDAQGPVAPPSAAANSGPVESPSA